MIDVPIAIEGGEEAARVGGGGQYERRMKRSKIFIASELSTCSNKSVRETEVPKLSSKMLIFDFRDPARQM